MGAYHEDLWLVYFNLVAGTSKDISHKKSFEGQLADTEKCLVLANKGFGKTDG